MKLIPLPRKNGETLYAKVDDEDFDRLSGVDWRASSNRYAVKLVSLPRKNNGKKAVLAIWMHRVIAGTPDGLFTDHINGDTLDNRRCNLRFCTTSENAMNRKRRRDNQVATGVNKVKLGWEARICVRGKRKRLGIFKKKEDAVAARKSAEMLMFGEFAPKSEVNS